MAVHDERCYCRARLLQPSWSGSGDYEVFDAQRCRRYRLDALSFAILTVLGTPLDIGRLSTAVSRDRNVVAAVLDALRSRGLVTQSRNGSAESSGDLWTPAEIAVQRQAPLGRIRDGITVAAPPPVKPPQGNRIIPLDPCNMVSAPLAQVLQRRRSVRSFSSRPVTLAELSVLLDRSARIRRMFTVHGTPLTMRPYPSAGARHSLEIYLFCDRVDDLSRGVYHYDPQQHALALVRDASSPDFDAFLAMTAANLGASRAEFPVTFYFTSVFARTMCKYHGTGLLAIYRDTGCLLQTLYLAATDIGLAGCAVAGLEGGNVASWLGHDPIEEGHVGSFVLGHPRGE